MKGYLSILLAAVSAAAFTGVASAQPAGDGPRATLFDQPNFQGGSITVVQGSPDLAGRGFASRAMSGHFDGDWTLCDSPGLDGRCASVRGDIADLSTVGLSRRVVSLREAEGQDAYARGDPYADEDARTAQGSARDNAPDADDERVPGPHAAAPQPASAATPAARYASEPGAANAPATLAAARTAGEGGRSAIFFARPQRGGADVEVDVQGPANQFCHEQGLGPAVYFDTDGRALRDVLCRRN